MAVGFGLSANSRESNNDAASEMQIAQSVAIVQPHCRGDAIVDVRGRYICRRRRHDADGRGR